MADNKARQPNSAEFEQEFFADAGKVMSFHSILFEKIEDNTLFLRAERLPGGRRTFKLIE